MHRNGVGTERVEHNQPVTARRRFAEPQARVADDDLNTGHGATAQVGKVVCVSGNADDRRVDLIKRPFLRGFGVTGSGARSQPHYGDARGTLSRVVQFQDVSQWPGAMVVSERLALARGVNKLRSVQGVAVNEIPESAALTERDARNTKKISPDVQCSAVRPEIKPAADQNSSQAQTEAKRPVNESKTHNRRQADDHGVAQIDRC